MWPHLRRSRQESEGARSDGAAGCGRVTGERYGAGPVEADDYAAPLQEFVRKFFAYSSR